MITTNSLKELVEGKTVAIVGNGPSVLVNELGYLIDSADLVFRFNNFYIGKFEKYSGKKTSVWVTSMWSYIIHPLGKFSVICPFPLDDPELLEIQPHFADSNFKLVDEDSDVLYMPMGIYKELLTYVDKPSSGCSFLFWLYKVIGTIDKDNLFGFDFFKNSNLHYYSAEDTSHITHSSIQEESLILQMCGDNPNFMDLGEISGEQGREDYQQGWQSFFGSYFKSKSILDVGAGLGLSKKRLETGGNQVMLQDIGPGLDVDFACSIEKIEEVFDVVTCFDVIEHVYEDTKFLESLYNLSKDGVVLTTPNYNVSRCSNKFHIREYTPNGLIQLARDLTDDKIYMWSSIDPHGGSPVEHTEESFNLSMDPVLSIYITK